MKLSLFKSTINGIGSGAGVAWPLFGLLFALIGGSVGGIISLTLGGLAVSLFLLVCLPIIYFSHKQALKDEQRLTEQIQKNENKLLSDIDEYIKSIQRCYLYRGKNNNFASYYIHTLNRDLNQAGRMKKDVLYSCLNIINAEYAKYSSISNTHILKCIMAQIPPSRPSRKEMWTAAFFAFAGTFGSLAGCSAGFLGLLTGVGIFSSLTAYPILGWSILGVAIIVGLCAASFAHSSVQEQAQKQLNNQTLKQMHKQLNKLTMDRNLDIINEQLKSPKEEVMQHLTPINKFPLKSNYPPSLFTPQPKSSAQFLEDGDSAHLATHSV